MMSMASPPKTALWQRLATALQPLRRRLPALKIDYHNDFERTFCALRLEQHCTAVARTLAVLSVSVHAISLFTDRFIVSPLDRSLFFNTHLSFLLMHALWWTLLRRTKLQLKHYLWCLQALFVVFMGYVLWRTIDRAVPGDIILASSGLIVSSSTMLLLCPFGNSRIVFTAILYEVIAAVAFSADPLVRRWIWIDILVLTVITVAQLVTALRTKSRALHEYRTLVRVAPRLVVQQALMSESSLEAAFHPQMRPVACISSDWRNYQKFSQSQNPDVVAASLSAYYTLCNNILETVAPQGNYYSDWIADELFIVFYGRWGTASRSLAAQAVTFARALLAAKPAFMLETKMPQGIDLGISVGTAFVGMMGAKGHSKATALGETPGISRRLQAAGKLLRQRLGERDRIIADTNVVAWLKRSETFQQYALAPNERLRDLDSEIVFYLEAADASTESSTPQNKKSA